MRFFIVAVNVLIWHPELCNGAFIYGNITHILVHQAPVRSSSKCFHFFPFCIDLVSVSLKERK